MEGEPVTTVSAARPVAEALAATLAMGLMGLMAGHRQQRPLAVLHLADREPMAVVVSGFMGKGPVAQALQTP
jgi:hypothetical protein